MRQRLSLLAGLFLFGYLAMGQQPTFRPDIKGGVIALPPDLSQSFKGGKAVPPPPPPRPLSPMAKEPLKQKIDPKKHMQDYIYFGPIIRNGCQFWLGKTCLDKDIQNIKSDGIDQHLERLTRECDGGKGEYCYLIYRYYFDSGQDDRAQKLLTNMCKDFSALCLREVDRLRDVRLFFESTKLAKNICKIDPDFNCSNQLERIRKIQDINIFIWAQNSSDVRRELGLMASVKSAPQKSVKVVAADSSLIGLQLKKNDKVKLKLKKCHWETLMESQSEILCETEIPQVKVKPIADYPDIMSMIRKLPNDISWEKSIHGVVAEVVGKSAVSIISLVVTDND